jgi:hypothetical protein
MMGDVPGMMVVPDPSLGGAPHVEGPTTHLHGVARPANQTMLPRVERAGALGRQIDSRMVP